MTAIRLQFKGHAALAIDPETGALIKRATLPKMAEWLVREGFRWVPHSKGLWARKETPCFGS